MERAIRCWDWVDPMVEEARGCMSRTRSLGEIRRSARKREAQLVGFDEEPVVIDNTDPVPLEKLAKSEVTPSKSPYREIDDASSCANNSFRLPEDTGEASHCYGDRENSEVGLKIEAIGDAELRSHEESDRVLVNKTAKSQLLEICAANYWTNPSFVLCGEEGLGQQRMFTYKVIVKVDAIVCTLLECFGEPRAEKRTAQEHAAEGALWFLKHLGYSPES